MKIVTHVPKSLFQRLKLRFDGNGRLYSTLGSYLLLTRFLALMAASKIGTFVLKGRRPCPIRISSCWLVAKTTGTVGFLSIMYVRARFELTKSKDFMMGM